MKREFSMSYFSSTPLMFCQAHKIYDAFVKSLLYHQKPRSIFEFFFSICLETQWRKMIHQKISLKLDDWGAPIFLPSHHSLRLISLNSQGKARKELRVKSNWSHFHWLCDKKKLFALTSPLMSILKSKRIIVCIDFILVSHKNRWWKPLNKIHKNFHVTFTKKKIAIE